MENKPTRDKYPGKPVERHISAAWAEISQSKPVSNVAIPSMEGIEDAKGYVDENEK